MKSLTPKVLGEITLRLGFGAGVWVEVVAVPSQCSAVACNEGKGLLTCTSALRLREPPEGSQRL
jgi:hypothetical protein